MKTPLLKSLLIIAFLSCTISIYAQNSSDLWQVEWTYPKQFIENKGQFDNRDRLPNSKILYAVDHGAIQIFFTKEGVTYRLDNKIKNPDKNRKKGERPKLICNSDYIYMKWEGANPDVEIVAEGAQKDYHTYSMLGDDRESYYDLRNINGYKKITYKNLYQGIDVEYVFHPKTGIKYSLYVKPGADVSQVKMLYDKSRNLSINTKGNLIIATSYGDIIEHAPLTFYASNKSEINSKFTLNNNIVAFELSNYDKSKPIVVDPWVQTPTLSNSNGVWELDIDGNGNVYVIGGDMPMRLQKYSSAGALQWTYNTPWDTANFWLGTLTVDVAGNSYITAGSSARVQKVSTTGSMVYSANGGSMDEYWMITFNCDKTKLIIGGTRLNPVVLENSRGVIFDIDINNGSVLNVQAVDTTRPGPMGVFNEPCEVRALTSSKNGRYYYLTLESVGAINQNFNVCTTNDPVFHTSSNYKLAYKSEDYRPNNGNAGNRAIRTSKDFLYTVNGSHVQKRSLVDGAVITTVAIPSGISTATAGFNKPGNGGIAIDSCGNVYVGSVGRIVKFDSNLNYITHTVLPFTVSDVSVGIGGEVVVVGTTGTSSSTSRTGYVQSINMSSCPAYSQACCLTTVCPVGPFCHYDAPVTLVTELSGGTFSGPGVNPTTGVFDPAAAGPGAHIITYTLPCGSSDIIIVVNFCAQLSVCAETSGQITVSGGMGPYTWEEFVPASSTPIASQAECVACGYTWLIGQCLNGIVPVTVCNTPAHWAQFATGTTVTPTVNYPLKVTDSQGNTVTINDFASLPECLPCPPIDVATSNIANATCIGGANGSFTAIASGGTAPYTYVLTLGGTTVAAFPNVNGAQDFTGLTAGTYILNVTDSDNCPGTATVVIGEDPFVVTANSNTPVCEGASILLTATGGTTYSWAGPNGFTSTTQNPTLAPATQAMTGSYSVTISVPPCTDVVTFDVTVNPSPSVDAGLDQIITEGDSIMLSGTGSLTFSWTPTTSLSNPSIANPYASPSNTTAYVLTTTNEFGCSASDTVVITVEHIIKDLFVPNIFSPNGDGQNDILYVYGNNFKEMKFYVYNRWGEKVFESVKTSDGWDGTHKGKACDVGVYVYYLDVIFLDDKEERVSGNVTLVR